MTAGRLTWREPSDGLVGVIDRYPGDRWCVTVRDPTRPGATAAVRATRDDAVAAVKEVVGVARERRVGRVR